MDAIAFQVGGSAWFYTNVDETDHNPSNSVEASMLLFDHRLLCLPLGVEKCRGEAHARGSIVYQRGRERNSVPW